jgi:hypothetical protein
VIIAKYDASLYEPGRRSRARLSKLALAEELLTGVSGKPREVLR